jgi:hypothetical protein
MEEAASAQRREIENNPRQFQAQQGWDKLF